MELSIEKFNIKHFKEIKNIYCNSFPKNERFPFWILILNILRGNSELYILFENNEVCGFTYLINYKNMTFILYLAIDENKRNNGCGRYILKWCLNKKKDRDIYLNIDEVNDSFEDNEIRGKRLNFYLDNNFYLNDYLSLEKCGNFNILSTRKEIVLEEYKDLDRRISKWFFNKKSKIVKNKITQNQHS